MLGTETLAMVISSTAMKLASASVMTAITRAAPRSVPSSAMEPPFLPEAPAGAAFASSAISASVGGRAGLGDVDRGLHRQAHAQGMLLQLLGLHPDAHGQALDDLDPVAGR